VISGNTCSIPIPRPACDGLDDSDPRLPDQEQAFGSLGARARERLRQLSLAFEKGSDSAVIGVPEFARNAIGSSVGDQVHLVNVHVNGYEYHGTRYHSLSEIAAGSLAHVVWPCFSESRTNLQATNSGGPMSADRKPMMRCAIYTRKSSEEGLEQSFNSLDAQREACEAFIASQRHEGWQAIATRYDDGDTPVARWSGPPEATAR